MKVRKSIEIAAPPEKVWPFLIEPEKIKKWFTTLEKFEYSSDQRTGVHIPLYFEETFTNRHLEIYAVVDEWVQYRKIAIRAMRSNYPRRYLIAWVMEPTDSGSWFTFFEDFEHPYGLWGKILGVNLMGWVVLRATVGKHVSQLKRLVEAEGSQESG